MKKKYFIKSKKFNEWYEKIDEIYANICIINDFCQQYKEEDEFYKVIPLLRYTRKTAEILYSEFIPKKF